MRGIHVHRGARLSVWPSLPPTVYMCGRSPLPFPLNHPGCRLFGRARHGLWQGLKALGLGEGDAVLVPAFHHGSEIEAIEMAGVRCVFYDVAEDLSPDPGQLENLLARDVRALHLTHYFGFPQDARRWRRWCDERGLLLFEDAAQAWLAQHDGHPVGSDGDLAVFCLYKTFGLPDGGAVLCRAAIEPPPRQRPSGVSGLARKHLAWALQQSGWGIDRDDRYGYDPEADFALGDPATPVSSATIQALPRLGWAGVAEARRARYRALLETLHPLVLPPFAAVPDGAAPFLLPVRVPNPSTLVEALRSHGVHALDVWSVPHPSLPVRGFPAAHRLRRHLVGLPVHQELRKAQVRRIADLVAAGASVNRATAAGPISGVCWR